MVYPDYEDAILARQERQEIMEDADDLGDGCAACWKLSLCRKAADGQGEFPSCPHQEQTKEDEW